MALSLDTLEALDLIARRGSFSAAAREIGCVPSALSYQIRKLEEELDVLIFDRKSRRARLTEAGHTLLNGGRLLRQEAAELAHQVRQLASGWEPELRIAIDATIPFDRLLPMIRDFERLSAPTRLRFTQEVLHGCWDALIEERAALAVGAPYDAPFEAFGTERFGMEPLGEMPFIFCVAPHHPLAQGQQPIDDDTLSQHRAVVVADSSRALGARTTGLLSGQSTLTVATFEQKIAAQVAGLGCGYLPATHAATPIANGTLRALRLASAREPASLRYAWRKAGRGRALEWWLSKLALPRVRKQLLHTPRITHAGRSAS
jgi:DNA-binding transcriptional LysR family regulator